MIKLFVFSLPVFKGIALERGRKEDNLEPALLPSGDIFPDMISLGPFISFQRFYM